MEAGTFRNSLIHFTNDTKLLPGVAIYGKNGGDKSNVIRDIWQASTVPDEERMLSRVVTKEPTYKKGNMDAISRIAENYPTAVMHAGKTGNNLLSQGLSGLEDTDERNE